MASSKVMASRSPSNPDLTRHSSLNPQTGSLSSMNMEDIIRNLYTDPEDSSFTPPEDNNNNHHHNAAGRVESVSDGNGGGGSRTMDDAWRDIVNGGGGGGGGSGEQAMTLENFLAQAGVGGGEVEEEVRVPAVVGIAASPVIMSGGAVQFGNGGFGNGGMVVGGSGRGKRKAGGGGVEEPPLDKATQQKQRRMIKNRESAARSRERKQAYTMELEALVTQLEKENAWLLKQQAEMNKERYKQLMETLIPVVEKRRPPRVLRRVHSMEW